MIEDIYQALKAASIPLDNHESDLYCKVTPESQSIIDQYKHKENVKTFKSAKDGCLWFDIPFAFFPFWKAKAEGK